MRTLKRKDIKAYKEELLKKKGGKIDPITYLPLVNIVLDHDHKYGYCRDALETGTNQFIGKIESNYIRFLGYKKGVPTLPEVLIRIAQYLNSNYCIYPLHPGWADLQVRKFSRANKDVQSGMLVMRGIKPGKTSAERTKQLKKWFYEQ